MESQTVTPEEVWDQDVAQGGAVGGELPARAGVVVVEGVTAVREAPVLSATMGLLTIAQNTTQRIGRNNRRRRLFLSVRPNTTATAYVVLAESAQQAAGGYGLPILQASPVITINYSGEVHFAAFGADVQVGFIAELDND